MVWSIRIERAARFSCVATIRKGPWPSGKGFPFAVYGTNTLESVKAGSSSGKANTTRYPSQDVARHVRAAQSFTDRSAGRLEQLRHDHTRIGYKSAIVILHVNANVGHLLEVGNLQVQRPFHRAGDRQPGHPRWRCRLGKDLSDHASYKSKRSQRSFDA